MLILAVLKSDTRKCERGPSKGRTITYRVGIGFDNYNVLIADTTSDSWAGRKFYGNLNQLFNYLSDYDIDKEEARKITRDAFAHAFDRDLPADITVEEMNSEFEVFKRIDDSTGELAISLELKKRWKNGNGDLIIWEPR